MPRDKSESAAAREEDTASTDPLGPEATAISMMLHDEGPLHGFQGPVLLLNPEQEVVAGNPAALSIIHGMIAGTQDRLTAFIGTAFSGSVTSDSLKISDPEQGVTTDLAAIPLDGGAHLLLMGRDVSLDDNLRATLVESRQRYKDLVEISSDFAWETGERGTFVFVSPGGALGYGADDLVGQEAASFVERPEDVDVDLPFTTRRPMYDAEFRFRRPDGEYANLIASALPLLDEQGVWHGVRGVCRDVTEALARDAALARSQNRERLMAYIVRTIRDEIEPAAMLRSATMAISRALSADGCQILRADSRGGFRQASTFGDPPADPVLNLGQAMESPAARDMGDYRAIAHATHFHHTVNGAVLLWRRAPSLPWNDEEVRLVIAIAGQVGIALQQVATHEQMEELSTTDPMTGLLNRRTFSERVRARVEPGDDRRAVAGVLAYVDLDNFKQVNDKLGHQAGNEALIAVARALRSTVRTDDLVARLGGDEFAVWLDGVDIALAETRAHDLLSDKVIFAPFLVDPDRPLGMSIGLAAFDPESGETLEELTARADAAMYAIKRGGKNALAVAPAAAPRSADKVAGGSSRS
jgi:diguanylate cyclase (GGDEF)-like protein/PAS domain S-box-containing protein